MKTEHCIFSLRMQWKNVDLFTPFIDNTEWDLLKLISI